ncbi:ASCH domain-containing protein [Embleya sp. NPDC059237]|uniref:ASCH domain-containing protein n=1 Tax=Embleya sp. NPDC059237 TaxID=3346784 RepID=UPI0036811152
MVDVFEYPPMEFAFPGPLRDALVAAVLDGTKTSTTGVLADYEHAGEELPRVGDRYTVVDSGGCGVGVIEIIEVRVLRLADVDWSHVRDEGEGDTSIAQWRANHEKFWHGPEMRAAMDDPGFTVDDDTRVVAQRFGLLPRGEGA